MVIFLTFEEMLNIGRIIKIKWKKENYGNKKFRNKNI